MGVWRHLTIFYLIRHGQSEAAANGGDPALSDEGRRQARQAAAYLRVKPIAQVYTSPLRRAAETAESIASMCRPALSLSKGLNSITDARLRERMNWGDIPGQSLEDFLMLWARCSTDRDYIAHGGVSARQAGERMADFMRDIARQYPQAEIVAVTHGGIIGDFLTNQFPKDELARLHPAWAIVQAGVFANGSVTEVRHEGQRFVVETLAQGEHLV